MKLKRVNSARRNVAFLVDRSFVEPNLSILTSSGGNLRLNHWVYSAKLKSRPTVLHNWLKLYQYRIPPTAKHSNRNYQNYKRPHPILSKEIKTNTEPGQRNLSIFFSSVYNFPSQVDNINQGTCEWLIWSSLLTEHDYFLGNEFQISLEW